MTSLFQEGKSSVRIVTGHNLWYDRGDGSNSKPDGTSSTVRALFLRNGNRGVQGIDREAVSAKMNGKEKLELLAGDLMKQTAQDLGVEIDLDKGEKIAQSQFLANLDEIKNFQDHELFMDTVKTDIETRRSPDEEPFKSPTEIAEYIAARIHNNYRLASGWKLVYQFLRQIRQTGFEDSLLRILLSRNKELRTKYLVLYDVVKTLASLLDDNVTLLTATSPHFGGYFERRVDCEEDEPEYVPNPKQLEAAQQSFLDSIVIELCSPHSRYPKHIMYILLGEAMNGASQETKECFSQTLWDAIGDHSIAVQLQEMLEGVLCGPEGEKWKHDLEHLPLPPEYDDWLDAHALSAHRLYVANWKDTIHPLERTRSREVLNDMWDTINLNYRAFTDKDIDALWNLKETHQHAPSWHPPTVGTWDTQLEIHELPSVLPSLRRMTGSSQWRMGGRLTCDDGYESDDSMPSLRTVSDSSHSSEGSTKCNGDDSGSDSFFPHWKTFSKWPAAPKCCDGGEGWVYEYKLDTKGEPEAARPASASDDIAVNNCGCFTWLFVAFRKRMPSRRGKLVT